MNAQKFQLRYSQVEDRILIIVTDDSDQDEVFGLTRRLVKRLVPGLEKVLRKAGHLVQPNPPESTPVTPAPTPAEAVAFSAQRKKKTQASATPAASNVDDSLDPAPVAAPSHLVTRLRVTDKGEHQHLLQITDGLRSLGIPLTDEQLAQFSHGIITVLKNADWDLNPAVAEPPVTGDDDTADTGSAAIDITADSPSKYRH